MLQKNFFLILERIDIWSFLYTNSPYALNVIGNFPYHLWFVNIHFSIFTGGKMTPIPGSSSQTWQESVFNEFKMKDRTLNQDAFLKSAESDLIARGDVDTLLKKNAYSLIDEIKTSKSLVKIDDFFRTVGKMTPQSEEVTLLGGYLEFRKYSDLQWVALSIAQDVKKDVYLCQLVDECEKTKNKEIAIQAANAISRPSDKAKYLARISHSNHF
jgi:hypothetical protein